ncbi:alpha-ribazole phosphatase [Siphonobacter sp. SORGH_AS_0500]|uniref:alpha-ribazole phosphatase n=1 Tax=Siphonobacter sp. SORGH_AS_0500 TaxID=1864824 RepID=UPI000CABB8C5|nr:alpha-ribazole phosphatase [Siphonobacter sp. SORGH_AS_0500]PKK38182.1 alpha-ribazole phosphatase [Siphonobacter sp. SORGH_AS_0500]
MDLFVMRHTSVHNTKGMCYGQREVDLSENYYQEIQQITRQFTKPFDVVYTSPLKRCVTLAEQIPSPLVLEEKRLMEINFGDWEGQLWNDLQGKEVTDWMNDFVRVQPPGGESLEMVCNRVQAFLEELRQQSYERVAIVTHAGVLRCIWANLIGVPLPNIFKIKVDYGQVDQFTLHPNPALDQWVGRIL